MYEIRCIVGDNKLREVLVFLGNSNTLEPPVVLPVNANLGNNPTKAVIAKPAQAPTKQRKKPLQVGGKHLKGKGATAIIRDILKITGAPKISATEMREATVKHGYSPGAYSHAIKLLLADKTIRKAKKYGTYMVMKP